MYSLPQNLILVTMNYWATFQLSNAAVLLWPCDYHQNSSQLRKDVVFGLILLSITPDSLHLSVLCIWHFNPLSLSILPNFFLAFKSTFDYYSRYRSDLETTILSHLCYGEFLILYITGLPLLALTPTMLLLSRHTSTLLYFSAQSPCRLTFWPISYANHTKSCWSVLPALLESNHFGSG